MADPVVWLSVSAGIRPEKATASGAIVTLGGVPERVSVKMHIISRKRLNDFATKHPGTKSALQQWYRLMKSRSYSSFVDLRSVFPSADQVGKLTVFNTGGNKARLVAAVHYNRRKVYIRAGLTHEEYDQGKWEE